MLLIIFPLIFIIIFLFIYNIQKFTTESPLNMFFDKVYVIALEDRKKRLEKVLSKINLKYDYIEPIYKKDLNRKELIEKNIITPSFNFNRKNGAIACYMSHLKTIDTFINSKYKNCLILEDDLAETDYNINDFNNKINDIINDINNSRASDYDIIYFGRCFDNCKKNKYITDNISTTTSPHCTHAYALSRKGAIKIKNNIGKLRKMYYKNAIDNYYKYLIRNNNLNAYVITPSIFNQNRDEVGTEIGNYQKLRECL